LDNRRQQTTADSIVRALRRHGVEFIFGQSIPTQIHLAGPRYGIRSVTYRTENAGGAAALARQPPAWQGTSGGRYA